MSEINVTPLVDVMLVLLVIFIIAAPLMASRIQLDLPPAAPASATQTPEPAAAVSLSLNKEGQLFWDDQPLDMATARQRLAEAAKKDASTEVQLRADAAAPYGQVVQLIGMAQAAGLSRIGFAADPETGAPLPVGASNPAR